MSDKKSHPAEHHGPPQVKTFEKAAPKPQTLAVEPQEAVPSVPEACEAFITFVEGALHDSAYQEAAKLEIASLRKSLAA